MSFVYGTFCVNFVYGTLCVNFVYGTLCVNFVNGALCVNFVNGTLCVNFVNGPLCVTFGCVAIDVCTSNQFRGFSGRLKICKPLLITESVDCSLPPAI